MGEGDPPAIDLVLLRRDVAELQRALLDAQTVINRCVLLSMAASLVAYRAGREFESVDKTAGLASQMTPFIAALEHQMARMQATMEEVAGHAK